MMRPEDRHYLESHEWAKKDGDVFLVGITDFAIEKLGELVFLELPASGTKIQKGERFGEIESVKAVSDLYSPVSGEIVEAHDALTDKLENLAQDPFGEGWLLKIRPEERFDTEGLLDSKQYEAVVEKES